MPVQDATPLALAAHKNHVSLTEVLLLSGSNPAPLVLSQSVNHPVIWYLIDCLTRHLHASTSCSAWHKQSAMLLLMCCLVDFLCKVQRCCLHANRPWPCLQKLVKDDFSLSHPLHNPISKLQMSPRLLFLCYFPPPQNCSMSPSLMEQDSVVWEGIKAHMTLTHRPLYIP